MFASYLNPGRRGCVTSNPVEQFNNVLVDIRKMPAHTAVLALLEDMSVKTVKRYNNASKERNAGYKFPKAVRKLHEEKMKNRLITML